MITRVENPSNQKELDAAEKSYLSGVESLLNLIETEARLVLTLRPEISKIVDSQGVSYIKLHNGRKIEFNNFPRLQAALELWYDHNRLDPGLYLTSDDVR